MSDIFNPPILSTGSHAPGTGKGCVMEQLSWIVGEPWSDHPKCVDSAVAAMLRILNDGLFVVNSDTFELNVDPRYAPQLMRLAARAVGTGPGLDPLEAQFSTWSHQALVRLALNHDGPEAALELVEKTIDRLRAEKGLVDDPITEADFVRAYEAITA